MAAVSLTFAAAAADYVLDRGPLTVDELHALALEAGVTKARGVSSLRTSLQADRRFVVRPDGRYDTAARLLTGSVLTTRLRRGSSDGVLWLTRDLDPLLALAPRGSLPLAGGGELRRGAGAAECWVGPGGWLSALPPTGLLGLRWTGRAVAVEPVTVEAPAGALHDVRRVLARHATVQHRRYWVHDVPPPLATVVLSALVEAPDLLREPLPPLSELLPLPEDLRPQDTWGGDSPRPPASMLHVPVPLRVEEELGRRADLLGERLPDYVGMLLSAAADRLLPPAPVAYQPYDDGRWSEPAAYDEPVPVENSADVVDLSRWSR